MQARSRTPRVDDFLRNISQPSVHEPGFGKDFGMYQRMSEAFDGLHDHLDNLRRNQGRLGFSAQNLMSDLSKAYIDAAQRGDETEMAFLGRDMENLTQGLDHVSADGELAESGNRFGRTVWQESLEAELFGKIWPVITGVAGVVPELTHWQKFQGNVQAFLYGFLDVVSELSKAKDLWISSGPIAPVEEIGAFERYLAVADSIVLRLGEERHVPGYIISNGFGRFNAYANKLRTAQFTIANVRRDYNLRRFIQMSIRDQLS